MFLRSSYEKAFNVEMKLDKLEKNISKMNGINKDDIDKLIDRISSWYVSRVNEMTSRNKVDVLDFALFSKLSILDYLNFNGMIHGTGLDDLDSKFKEEYEFRREILFATQYKILSVLGKNKGSEYVLLFEKAFNFDFEPAIRYAYYEGGIYSEEYMRFLDTYLKLGGATNAYVLKDYYSGDENSKYCVEELSTILNEIKEFKNMQKQKKMDF